MRPRIAQGASSGSQVGVRGEGAVVPQQVGARPRDDRCQLLQQLARRAGPRLLLDVGFTAVDVRVVQPLALQGEVKQVSALTLENIAAAVLEDGLATADEIAARVQAL